ncbi:hypothetical protein ACFRC1_05700 [Streptomyces sp. NPDC056626]|uniref:hypothetical protein n=1 Tax=Streptomyces sp. NPDC056626 TaxID=3345880 RepID=UPI00367A1FD5
MGAVVGVVAAIGSLAFTGVATYYGAATAREQLDQARQDRDDDERSQALRFTWWTERSPGHLVVHLQNRSPDPIYSPELEFYVPPRGIGDVYLATPSVPPCTVMTFDAAKIAKSKIPMKWERGDVADIHSVTLLATDGSATAPASSNARAPTRPCS